jgi:hypothetical protein
MDRMGPSDSFATPEKHAASAKKGTKAPRKAPGIPEFLPILPNSCEPPYAGCNSICGRGMAAAITPALKERLHG